MLDQRVLRGLAVFSAGYMKRWLEGNLYDRISASELGRKLIALDKKARYGIEFGLNLLTAFFEQKLAEDTVLKRFMKEILVDAGPEISKRLINNTKQRLVASAESVEEKELVSVLLGLDDQTLIDLLNWLYDREAVDRADILKKLSRLPLDDLVRLAQLPSEGRDRLFGLFEANNDRAKKPRLSSEVIRGVEEATAKIEDMRSKLRARREKAGR